MDLYKVPEYLIIHLKRFKNSNNYAEKNLTKVNFPLENLDLSDYVLNKTAPKTHFNEIEDYDCKNDVNLVILDKV
jgi:ubiquitin carboxyl-terminal hydrolase 4/11